MQLCYPTRYYVEEVKGEPLPPAELMAAARKQLPDSIPINGLRVFPDPERTYQVVLPGKKAAAFIDPYTGKLTGVDDGQGFFMQTMRLHRWLLDNFKPDRRGRRARLLHADNAPPPLAARQLQARR